MSLPALLAIARKDLLDALRNARLLVIVLMPVGFSLLYGYLFRDTPSTLEIVLFSPDETQLITLLAENDSVSLFQAESPESLTDLLEREKAAVGLILPPGFDQSLEKGERPQVEVVPGEDRERGRAATRLIEQLAEAISGRPAVITLQERQPGPGEQSGASAPEEPLGFFEGLDLHGYFLVLWILMGITMNGALLVPTLLVEEKERGTLEALLVAPASYADVVGGKLLVGVVYSLLTALVVMGLNGGFVGKVWVSAAVVFLASIALALIGLLLGGLVENLSSLNNWSGLIMLPLMLPGILGGVPLGNLGAVLKVPLQLMPTYHLVRGLVASTGGGVAEGLASAAVLAVESLLLFAAVVWSLKRREA